MRALLIIAGLSIIGYLLFKRKRKIPIYDMDQYRDEGLGDVPYHDELKMLDEVSRRVYLNRKEEFDRRYFADWSVG